MTWATETSKIFRRVIQEMVTRGTAVDWDTDAVKVALFNNTTAPDRNVTTVALASFNGTASQWVTANEVIDATGWPTGGRTLTVAAPDTATSNVIKFDATDLASANSTTTLTATFGCLVYDSTLAAQSQIGFCFNYFGGTQSVSSGLFTIVWDVNGVFQYTV